MPIKILYHLSVLVFSLFLSIFIFQSPAWAGFQFLDPDIPDNETITYQSTSEGNTTTITEQIRHVIEGDNNFYEIVSLSPVLDTRIRINRKDMTVDTVHTIQRYDTATINSTLLISNEKPNSNDQAIKVPHFVALSHLLRGFPFESKNTLKISYYGGSTNKKFKLCVKNKHRETIKVMGEKTECYKLEFGLCSFLGVVLPELELWYSVAPPHYMVRYKGPEGPPGTPKRFIEITDYQTP